MENSILKKISKQRMLVMIVFAAACVYCAMSISKVKVNEDITTFASANVMLANTTYDRAKSVAGEISSITNSIAVIMQLALAIDYAIIFSHRYQDETERFPTEYDALNELSYTRDGSRIVFTLENGGSVVLLSAQRGAALLLPIAVAVVVAAGVAAFFVVRKKKAAKNKAE